MEASKGTLGGGALPAVTSRLPARNKSNKDTPQGTQGFSCPSVTLRPPSFGRTLNKSAAALGAPSLTPVAQVDPAATSPSRSLSSATWLQIGTPTYRPYTDMAARIAPLWSTRAELPCSDAP